MANDPLPEVRYHIKRKLPEVDCDYPPIGTAETCLVLVISNENFFVLGYTGRFLTCQIDANGAWAGEELGIEMVPDKHGYWVMESGRVSGGGKDFFSGEWNDAMIGGIWRPATVEDFKAFNAELPAGFGVAQADTVFPTDPLSPDLISKPLQKIRVEGKSGGSFICMEEVENLPGEVSIEVGLSCVYTINEQLMTVDGIAAIISAVNEYGVIKFLRENSYFDPVEIAKMFPES